MAENKIGYNPRDYRADEVQVRKGNYVGQDKDRVELLLYADARACQEVLDETFGQYGWVCNYKMEGDILFCGIGIKDPVTGQFIWRWNSGAEQNFEREKSVASDALKRCAVLHGIGRSLYSAPRIIVPNENKAYKVSEISYEDHKITGLVITDNYGNVVYDMSKGGVQAQTGSAVSKASKYPPENKDLPWDERLKAWCGTMKDQNQSPDDQTALLAFYWHVLKQTERGAKWGIVRLFEWFMKDLHEGTLIIDDSNPKHPKTIKK